MRQLFIAGDWLFIAIGVAVMSWSAARMVVARTFGRRHSGRFMVGMGITMSSIAGLLGSRGTVGWPDDVQRIGIVTTMCGAIIAYLGRRAEGATPASPGA